MIAEIKKSIERLNNQLNIIEGKSNGVDYKSAENIHTEPWRTKRMENAKS